MYKNDNHTKKYVSLCCLETMQVRVSHMTPSSPPPQPHPTSPSTSHLPSPPAAPQRLPSHSISQPPLILFLPQSTAAPPTSCLVLPFSPTLPPSLSPFLPSSPIPLLLLNFFGCFSPQTRNARPELGMSSAQKQ